jgi:hypothetical protein
MRDQVSTGKIIILYILMFIFIESKREERFSTEWQQTVPDFKKSRQGNIFLSSPKHPDRLWDPPSVLLNRYQGPFPGVDRPGHRPL